MKKNKCLSEELLNDYLDRCLTNGVLAEVEEHLKACKTCRNRVFQLRVIFDGLERIKIPELPCDFTEKTMAFVKEEKQRRKRDKVLSIIAAASLPILLFLTFAMIKFISVAEDPALFGFEDLRQGWALFLNLLNAMAMIKSGLRGGQVLNRYYLGRCCNYFYPVFKVERENRNSE